MVTIRNNGFEVEFQVDDKGVLQGIEYMLARLEPSSIQNFLQSTVAPYLQDRVDARFQDEGDDAVGVWQALATATESIRSALGYGPDHPINVREGSMRDFLVSDPGDTSMSVDGASLTFPGGGADSLTQEKISTAQQGKSYPPTPPRPVLGINQIDENDISMDLYDFLVGNVFSSMGGAAMTGLFDNPPTVFPNNAQQLIIARLQALYSDLTVVGRPLRMSDSAKSVGVFPSTWVPEENSYEFKSKEPTLQRYTIRVQALYKDTVEERGIAMASIMAKVIRAMLYNDAPLDVGLNALSVTLFGARETIQRRGISRQQYLNNEVRGNWVYLSTLDYYVETETK